MQFIMSGKPLRMMPPERAQPVVDAQHLIEVRSRVAAAIADIDLLLMRSRSIERRSAASADDGRPPPGRPIEYSGGGYVLGVVMTPRRLRSAGDASVGLLRDPSTDVHMVAALQFTTTTNVHHVVELTLPDVRNLFQDLIVLLGADQAQVDAWWQRLADGRDGRPGAMVTTRTGGR